MRKKDDQSYIYFKETSIYRLKDAQSEKGSMASILGQSPQKLQYVEAIVTPLDQKEAEMMVKGTGYQGSSASIKDKW